MFTVKDLEIPTLMSIPKEVKWIAQNGDGVWNLFLEEPAENEYEGTWEGKFATNLHNVKISFTGHPVVGWVQQKYLFEVED